MEQTRLPRLDPSAGGLAAVLVATFGFSWGFTIAKAVGLPAPTIAIWRLIIGAAALLGVAVVLKTPWPKRPSDVVLAGSTFAAHQLLFVLAVQQTSIAIVTLLVAVQPLLISLLSLRFVGEAVPPGLRLSTLVAALGVGVVVFANRDHESHSLVGDALAALNVLAFVAYFLACKRMRARGTPALTLTASVLMTSAVIVLPLALLQETAVPPTEREWLLLAVLALGPGSGHLALNWAHARVNATVAALVLAAVPVLATIWAHLIFGEPYGPLHVVGMVLVVLAIEMGRRAEAAARPMSEGAEAR